MNRRTPFRIGIVGVSFLFAGALVATVDQTPISWMKATLLQSLGATSSVAQASPLDTDAQGNASFQIAKEPRPALNPNSPEVLERKQLPKGPPGPPPQLSEAQLLEDCQKRPNCLEKLKAIKSGKRKPLPAFQGETPEEQEMKMKRPKGGHPGAPGQQRRSEILLPEEAPSLLSWLNPFQVSTAYAQTVNISLYPGGNSVGNSYMYLRGAMMFKGITYLKPSDDYRGICKNCENNPYAGIVFDVPTRGNYFIYLWVWPWSGGSAKGKLRHEATGQIIDTWAYPAGYAWQKMGTTEFLEAGRAVFYFWPTEGGDTLRIHSANLVQNVM